MLWSHLKEWPADQPYPPEVRRHMRIIRLLDAREGDLTSWKWAKETEILRDGARRGPEWRAGMQREIEEIDRVLRWMRNEDWPFR